MADTLTQRTQFFKRIELKNKKYCIMDGDSIAYRLSLETNRSNYLYRKPTDKYLYTKAVSGANLANFTGGDSATWNPLSVVTKSNSAEVNSYDIKNCDILFVWAGFNDKNDNVPLGATNSTDSLTYAGAINNTVTNYLSRKSDIRIVFITPTANPYEVNNSLGLNILDYRNHMIATCAANGYDCFDLYAVCGITDENKAVALPDLIHPSSAFLETFAGLIANFING